MSKTKSKSKKTDNRKALENARLIGLDSLKATKGEMAERAYKFGRALSNATARYLHTGNAEAFHAAIEPWMQDSDRRIRDTAQACAAVVNGDGESIQRWESATREVVHTAN